MTDHIDSRSTAPLVQRMVAVLWPSFLAAGVATVLFFTAFDPQELALALGVESVERLEAYSIGFFLFWLLTASSSALTCYFQRPCDQFNR
jgi:hypothetical protein